jgi:hypothetical protein
LVTRRTLAEGALIVVALCAIVVAFYYHAAYAADHVRVRRLVLIENARCNATRSTLELAAQSAKDGHGERAAVLYSTISRDLWLCTRSRADWKQAEGDVDKLLQVTPQRDTDDLSIAEREDIAP